MTVLASDSFNRANSTTSLGSTDSYNGGSPYTWTPTNIGWGTDAWGISSNEAYSTTTNVNAVTIDVGQSDVDIRVTMSVYNGNSGIVFRVPSTSSSKNFYRLFYNNANDILLQKWVNGTSTTLATYTPTTTNGDILRVTCQGNTINSYLNGTLLGTVTDTDFQTATQHGIHAYSTTSARFDNFEIDSVGSSTTTYIGSGTSQGTSSVTSNETLILSPRTYAGNGVSTGISSLTTNEIKSYSASGTSQGNVSLSSAEHLIINTNGSSSQGTPPDTTTIDGTSSVSSNENYIYSANGSTIASSVVSSVGNVIYVDFGNSNGQSNLTTSEQLVSPTGTTYSESGQSIGLSSVSSNDKITYESSVGVNAQSTLTTTEHISLSAQGNTQGQSSATSTEQFIGHVTTTYSAIGLSDGTSNISSSETKSYAASGNVNGLANTTSHDNIVYFPSGTANGYTTINTSERYISVFEVIGIIELNGQIQLTLQFVGVIDLNINLKGVV